MAWKIGDLGRFENESSKQPRFEVVGASSEGVSVWYGGDFKPTLVPTQSFKKKCVDWWEMIVNPPTHAWMAPSANFYLGGHTSISQAWLSDNDPKSPKRGHAASIVVVDNHTLTIRSIRKDYASCLDTETKMLVMIPLKVIHEHAVQIRSFWDRLQVTDDFFKPSQEAELEKLMRNFTAD